MSKLAGGALGSDGPYPAVIFTALGSGHAGAPRIVVVHRRVVALVCAILGILALAGHAQALAGRVRDLLHGSRRRRGPVPVSLVDPLFAVGTVTAGVITVAAQVTLISPKVVVHQGHCVSPVAMDLPQVVGRTRFVCQAVAVPRVPVAL